MFLTICEKTKIIMLLTRIWLFSRGSVLFLDGVTSIVLHNSLIHTVG